MKLTGLRWPRGRKIHLLTAGVVVIGLTSATACAATRTEKPPLTSNAGTVNRDENASTGASPGPGSAIVRAAFYYSWFPGAWDQLGIRPFTKYHPSLGFYSSADPAVMRHHVDAMIYAGMNAAVYSWWGQKSVEDVNFSSYLATSAGKNLKWAVYYECEGNATGGNCSSSSPSVVQITSDLRYIRSRYTSDPQYLEINGKPVVFVYGDRTDSCRTADNWKQAGTEVGFWVILRVFPGYQRCSSQPDGWHQYAPSTAEDTQPGYSISISPGFYKANEPRPRLERDLNRWQQDVTDLKNSRAPLQLITTFNEFGEGTPVESTTAWESASGYGRYIDILHDTLVGRSGGAGR